MVTLAVILGLEALIMLVGGIRLVSKRRLCAQCGGERACEGVGRMGRDISPGGQGEILEGVKWDR